MSLTSSMPCWQKTDMTKSQKKLWIGLAVMALLSPLGVILPEKFQSGGAWGEWRAEALSKLLGYVPEGLRKYADLWKAPLPDYNPGGDTASLGFKAVFYILSGLLGIGIVVLAVYVIAKVLVKHEK